MNNAKLNEQIELIAENMEKLSQLKENYNEKLQAAMVDLKPVTPAYEAAIEV